MDALQIALTLIKTFEKYGYRCDVTCAHNTKGDVVDDYLKFVMMTLRVSKDDVLKGYIDIRGQKYNERRRDFRYPRVSSLEAFTASMGGMYKSPRHYYEMTKGEILGDLRKIVKLLVKE